MNARHDAHLEDGFEPRPTATESTGIESLDLGLTDIERRILDAFDDALEASEPLPSRLVLAAQDFYTWRTIDAELLELLVDSAETELALVRSEDRLQRFVAFGDDDHGVHFECVAMNDGFTLIGDVVPSGRYDIRVDQGTSGIDATTDEHGGFEIGGIVAGSTRLTLKAVDSSGRLVATPWFLLRD